MKDDDITIILLPSLRPSIEHLLTSLLYGNYMIILEDTTTTILSIEY